MLTQQWNVLRNVRVCDEPGAHKREGTTIHDYVARRLAAITKATREAEGYGRAPPDDPGDLWYTVDKKEVHDRHWELVATILLQFGFEDISPDDEGQRSVKIPQALCQNFQERVVTPWQNAWRAFRASQRSNRGGEGSGSEVPAAAAPASAACEITS